LKVSRSSTFASDDYLLGLTASSSRKAPAGTKPKPHKVNANSYCGRHSDEFLFGPHGFGDLWRSITKPE